MSFVSTEFLVFFCIVMPLYFVVPHRWRWLFLLVASYFFYAYYNHTFVFILLTTIIIDFFISKALYRASTLKRKKMFLSISLVMNLSILFLFKYFNFVNNSLATLFISLHLPYHIADANLILPVGISFYTFEEVSYIIDIYRGKIVPEERFGIFANFIIFFPKLVAGPIERAGHLMPQFDRKVTFDYDRIVTGGRLILWGVFKKVVIADRLAVYVNLVYNHPNGLSGWLLIIATLFFAFQIYCDFSAYSDIAIGTAKILGIDLLENFRQPYLSASIREFWRRWHISLSSWFRDYVYFPLGGNRVSFVRNLINLFVVFVISGLWHGASWTFVIWGALHGGYIVIETILSKVLANNPLKVNSHLVHLAQVVITFTLVCLAWIFFRANSIEDAGYIISHLFDFSRGLRDIQSPFSNSLIGQSLEFALSIGLIIALMLIDWYDSRFGLIPTINRSPAILRWAFYYGVGVAIGLSLFNASSSNFIYFQF